jgi:hypothetical protein
VVTRTVGYLLLGCLVVVVGSWMMTYLITPTYFRPLSSYWPFGLLVVVAAAMLLALRFRRQKQ